MGTAREAMRLADAQHHAGADVEKRLARLLRTCRKNAVARVIPFALTIDDLLYFALKCQWRCSVTRIPFSYEYTGHSMKRPFAPSIDRIDSADGYFRHNCRLVCVATNMAMSDWGEDVMVRLTVNHHRVLLESGAL